MYGVFLEADELPTRHWF